MFFVLMVGALKSPVSPPKGPTVDIFCVDDGYSRISSIAYQGARNRSQTSSNASEGGTMSRTFFSKTILGPCTAKDLER
jgi:hypothetical protein